MHTARTGVNDRSQLKDAMIVFSKAEEKHVEEDSPAERKRKLQSKMNIDQVLRYSIDSYSSTNQTKLIKKRKEMLKQSFDNEHLNQTHSSKLSNPGDQQHIQVFDFFRKKRGSNSRFSYTTTHFT